MMTEQEKKIRQLEAQLAMIQAAARRVLSDVDDDGIAEHDDMSILALRAALNAGDPEVFVSVVDCARRVYGKFGADSDWSEWTDLRQALDDLAEWPLGKR